MKDLKTRQLGGLEWESLCNISAVIIPSISCVYIKYNRQIFIRIISIIAIPIPQFTLSARKHEAGEAYARPINSLFFIKQAEMMEMNVSSDKNAGTQRRKLQT